MYFLKQLSITFSFLALLSISAFAGAGSTTSQTSNSGTGTRLANTAAPGQGYKLFQADIGKSKKEFQRAVKDGVFVQAAQNAADKIAAQQEAQINKIQTTGKYSYGFYGVGGDRDKAKKLAEKHDAALMAVDRQKRLQAQASGQEVPTYQLFQADIGKSQKEFQRAIKDGVFVDAAQRKADKASTAARFFEARPYSKDSYIGRNTELKRYQAIDNVERQKQLQANLQGQQQ